MKNIGIQSEDPIVKNRNIATLTTFAASYYLAFTWAFRASDFWKPHGILGIEISLYLLLYSIAIFKRSSTAASWINLSIILVVALHHAVRLFPYNSLVLSSLLGSAFFLALSIFLAVIHILLMKIWSKTGTFFYFFSALSCIFTCLFFAITTLILYSIGLVLVGIGAAMHGGY